MVFICLQMKVIADFGKNTTVNILAFRMQLTLFKLLKTDVQ